MAIVSKSQLINSINNDISDNSNAEISPEDIRHNLIDLIDSLHLLLDNTKDITVKNLISDNFYTPSNRSVIVGKDAISKLSLDGYVTNDNTAVGYAALKNNYQGSGNTAVGSFSLSCNVFGDNNSAFGVNTLSANTNGFGNTGFGNYALTRNKTGNFNIALGHAAGYYSKNENNKLFIESHSVDEKYICDNPLGSGLNPLVYGDLHNANLVFGIGTRTLRTHSVGVLQTSGSISPTLGSTFNIGHSSYRWKSIYLSDTVYLSDNVSFTKLSSDDGIAISGDIIPFDNNVYDLGSTNKYFASGYISHLFTDVTNTVANNHYENKVLYIASSGDPPSAYLTQEQLSGAGLVVRGSGEGLDTSTDFAFIFRPSGDSSVPLESLEENNTLSRSFWESNISFHTTSGSHVHTPRLMNSGQLDLLVYSSGQPEFGLYLNSGSLYVTSDIGGALDINPGSSSGLLTGIGKVNFLSPSGITKDYFTTIGALESGVTVGQRFLTGAKVRNKDSGGNDKYAGFNLKYIDDSNSIYSGPKTDRFVISSQDNTSYSINNLILMRNHSAGGVFGVNNFSDGGENLIPQTTFNVRSYTDAIFRMTAENTGSNYSAIQLLTNLNCLTSGFEILYDGGSRAMTEFNVYEDSGVVNAMRINASGHVGILSSGYYVHGISEDLEGYLTIGDSGSPNALVAIHETSQDHNHLSASGYVKLYAKEKIINTSQSSTLYAIDSSGNTFNLIRNKYIDVDNLVFIDDNRNTLSGSGCTLDRLNLSSCNDNTAYGYTSLGPNVSGDYNTAIGSYSLSGIVNGDYNIGLGYKSLYSSDGNYNIVIGNNINVGNSGNYIFKLGSNAGHVFMSGVMGPSSTDKILFLPSGGKIELDNGDASGLHIRTNLIKSFTSSDPADGFSFPNQPVVLEFHGSSGARLMEFNHNALPMSGVRNSGVVPVYETPDVARPYVAISGDARILGAIRFSDNTSLDTTNDIDLVAVSGASLSGQFYDNLPLIKEGTMLEAVTTASGFAFPTSGLMSVNTLDGSPSSESLFVTNRDKYSSMKVGDYVIAIKTSSELRPIWISNQDLACNTCCN